MCVEIMLCLAYLLNHAQLFFCVLDNVNFLFTLLTTNCTILFIVIYSKYLQFIHLYVFVEIELFLLVKFRVAFIS